MKKQHIITTVLIIMNIIMISISYAQTYIQGAGVRPFSEIGTSSKISSKNRIAYTDAMKKINEYTPKSPSISSLDKMAGEYFLIDGMIVNIVCRNRTKDYDFRPLSKKREEFRETYTNAITSVENPKNTLEDEYFDDLKKINNLEVLIDYYKTSNEKYFLIQDLLGKYVLLGTIYCEEKDMSKAEAAIEPLVKSMVLK